MGRHGSRRGSNVFLVVFAVGFLHACGQYGLQTGLLRRTFSEILTILAFLILSGMMFDAIRRAYTLRMIVRAFSLGSIVILLVMAAKVIETLPSTAAMPFFQSALYAALKEGTFAIGLGLYMASFYFCLFDADDAKADLVSRVAVRTTELSAANERLQAEILEHRQTEQRLQEASELNKTLIASSPVGIAAYKDSGSAVLVNEAMARIVGTESDVLLRSNFRTIPTWRTYGLLAAAERVLESGEPCFGDTPVVSSFGKSAWLEYSFDSFVSGGERHLLLIASDISDRKNAERALQESEAKYRELVQNANSIILRMDVDGNVTFFNAFAQRFFGYSESEIVGRSVVGTIVSERNGEGEDLAGMIHDIGLSPERYSNNENENVRRNGERVWIAWTNRPVYNPDGTVKEILCIGNDITARVRAERTVAEQRIKMLNAARMSALGVMAGGIAHEINNPLAIISVAAQQLEGVLAGSEPDPARVNKVSDVILRNVERVQRIVRALRSLSRESPGDPFERASLKVIVADVLELCQERFKTHGIALTFPDLAEDAEIECRASQLSQVILNLLNNAYDAVDKLPEKWVRLDVEDDGECVVFSVTDSGDGLASGLAAKAFVPFFTTKKEGTGTGLGLSISRSIVQDHGGELEIDPAYPNTRFVVRIPRSHPARDGADRGTA